MKELAVEIVTPESQVYKGEAVSVMVPGAEGLFQVLYNHAPIIASLGKGEIKLGMDQGDPKRFTVEGGVVEVMKNKVIILVEQVLSGDIQTEDDEDE